MTQPPNKPTSNLPHVDPRVTDPRAIAYARQSRGGVRAQAPGLPKYDTPIAGGPVPPIPILDSQHVDGMSMSQQAAIHRQTAAAPPPPQGSIFEQRPPQGTAQGGLPPPPPPIRAAQGPLNLLPNDLLPPEAQQDPLFQQGQGSMFAASQPDMARKYGVIRGDQRIPSQMLSTPVRGGAPAKLSPETVEGLKAFEALQNTAQQAVTQGEDTQAEAASRGSSAGEAANLGSGMSKAGQSAEMLDELDLDAIHQRMVRNLLQNEDQRKIIEERLRPLDLSELITQGIITQVVAIQPGIFEPEFQSFSQEDDLAIKRLIVTEANSLKVDDRYLLDKFGIMGLTCALRAINKKPMPDHHDQAGNFSDEMFWVKFNRVVKFPLPMIASLGTNYFYFDVRVRKLFVAERIKNG